MSHPRESAIERLVATGEWVRASALPDLVGVSYRMIDYWTKHVPGAPTPVWHDAGGNRIDPPDEGRGSGTYRLFPAAAVEEFRSLATLSDLMTMPVSRAAEHPHHVREALIEAIEAVLHEHYYDGDDDD